MKKIHKSYIILSIYELLVIIALCINSFVFHYLNEINLVIFLLIALVIFYLLLGNEKDKDRYVKDIIFEIIIFLLIFFLVYYLSGLLIGFYKNQYILNIQLIFKLILPTILKIIIMEKLRYSTIIKSEKSKLLIILNCFMFFMIDITNIITITNFNTTYTVFLFLSLNVLPLVTKNILASYLSLKFGYKPMIIYSLAMELYLYLIPIIPNFNNYIYSLLLLLLPVILGIKIYKDLEKIKTKELNQDYKKKSMMAFIIPLIVVVSLVYISSGYFKYYAITIGSGSMEPTIYKGDVVIIEKIKTTDDLKVGQIIAFKYNDRIIVHRLNKIITYGDDTFYYTKGDANTNIDNYPVTLENIIGTVNVKIPYIGILTIWINEI